MFLKTPSVVSLRSLEGRLKVSYRSNSDNLVGDFYIPCLANATLYRRSVGYFSSQGLAFAVRGISKLIARGGKMQLVASPALLEDDVAALSSATENRDRILAKIIMREMKDIEDLLSRERLNALAWMVADGCLEIRVALRLDSRGRIARGLYHEKCGIFSDDQNNHVAFSGSSNETEGGLIDNFESIKVFWSWEDTQRRVEEEIVNFDALWNDSTAGLKVLPFTQVSRELLERFKQRKRPSEAFEEFLQPEEQLAGFMLPTGIELRDYQQQALRNWFAANGQGIFKMATGSGKTITSLATAANLHAKLGLHALLIVCPYKHLVTQWTTEAERFGLQPIQAFESRNQWLDDLNARLSRISDSENDLFCVITTNATFGSPPFQTKLSFFPRKSMLIADEVHNLGATNLRNKLPNAVKFRLGLSATPERYHDDIGTTALFNYFGRIVEPEFSLADALKHGALTPYFYYPLLVELTVDEFEKYYDLSERISKIASFEALECDEHNPALDALLSQRARLIASAENKLSALRDLMVKKIRDKQMLFYCGDGRVEFDPDDGLMKQVDAVCRLLGNELGIKVSTFLADTSLDEREELKRRLATGTLQGLVAIRCLDEGVDVPSIRSAVILASSTNPRQFIQRRGRILRRDDASGKRSSEIFDMIVVPPEGSSVHPIERGLLRRELERFVEFASLATNSGEARGTILDIQKRFHLLDM